MPPKTNRCPICDAGCNTGESLLRHVFDSHLASVRKEPVVLKRCFCTGPWTDYASNRTGFIAWTIHLHRLGGLHAHYLAHLLGVNDAG